VCVLQYVCLVCAVICALKMSVSVCPQYSASYVPVICAVYVPLICAVICALNMSVPVICALHVYVHAALLLPTHVFPPFVNRCLAREPLNLECVLLIECHLLIECNRMCTCLVQGSARMYPSFLGLEGV
jgi:hypothetical protein